MPAKEGNNAAAANGCEGMCTHFIIYIYVCVYACNFLIMYPKHYINIYLETHETCMVDHHVTTTLCHSGEACVLNSKQ